MNRLVKADRMVLGGDSGPSGPISGIEGALKWLKVWLLATAELPRFDDHNPDRCRLLSRETSDLRGDLAGG